MRRFFVFLLGMVLLLLAPIANADESIQQLPNGDTIKTTVLPDGSEIVSIKHKDGSSKTTITSGGVQSVTIQHADGTTETYMTQVSD